MKKLPTSFYKELHELRDKIGETEYGRDDLLPAAMGLLSKHLKDENELLKDAANAILDRAERGDERAAEGFFPYDDHVALGEKRRIKRGAMNQGQMNRRKRVIDRNKMAQDESWRSETTWLNTCTDALDGMPPETKLADVLDEDSSANPIASAAE